MGDAPHLLVVMGSGETTPTMVTPHQQLLARLGDTPDAVLLDTPYGFQENADDITARTQEYFSRRVGTEVRNVGLRRPENASEVELEAAQAAVADADWVFVGPGSPTYLLRQLATTRVPEVLRRRLTQGTGITVVSSAAAVTIGSHAIPVYEIYKAGEDPHWEDGLGLLQAVGLDAVLIPHYDNSEGGGHDTRFCYLGEQRLRTMQDQLPDDTWVLGVDEHTALVADLTTRRVEVIGRGRVTVRRPDGVEHHVPAGQTTTLDQLVALGTGQGSSGTPAPTTTETPTTDTDTSATAPADDPLEEAVEGARTRFAAAIDAGDAQGATQVVLELEGLVRDWAADTLTGGQLDDAVGALRGLVTRLGGHAGSGLVDPRESVAPFVDLLLELREQSRADGQYATADRVRDGLIEAGVEVRDTPDGTEWVLTP
jgi:cyanophycinase-like exopeptidase